MLTIDGVRESVDRSTIVIRLLVASAIAIGCVSAVRASAWGAAIVGVISIIGVAASAFGERPLRRQVGAVPASAVVVAIDLAIATAIVWVYDAAVGSPLTLILAVPVFEAAVRHGMLGAIAAWLGASISVIVRVALEWDGRRLELADPFAFIAILLLVAIPAAHLSESLTDRIRLYAAARDGAAHRAHLLVNVLDSVARITGATPAEIDGIVAAGVGELVNGNAQLVFGVGTGLSSNADDQRVADGTARVVANESRMTSIEIEVGPDPDRCLTATTDRVVDDLTVEAIEMICAHARIAHRTAQLFARAHDDAERWSTRARTDAVTGVFNREGLSVYLLDKMNQPGHAPIAVVVLDLDDFKAINDNFGHTIGDHALRVAAERLTARPGSTVARLGGDEFVVVVELEPSESVVEAIEDIRRRLDLPIEVGPDLFVPIRASVGGLIVDPTTMSLEEAIHLADIAMFTDKRARKQLAVRQHAGLSRSR